MTIVAPTHMNSRSRPCPTLSSNQPTMFSAPNATR